MSESVTILRARGRMLAKSIGAGGEVRGYDRAKLVDLIASPVDDLAGLYWLLAGLQARYDSAIIRGAPADPGRVQRVRRLLHSDPETAEAPTIIEMPRRWLALDIDGLPAPGGIDLRDLQGCAQLALAALPEAFHGAACVVQATASHGLKPGLRLRLWCWLSRPLSGIEARAWLRGYPVDNCIFGAAQPIYTAAPLFTGGTDPLTARLAFVPGLGQIDPPPPVALLPPPKPAAAPPKLPAAAAGAYARNAVRNAAGRILAAQARHPAIVNETRGLWRLVATGLLPEASMRAAIHEAAAAVGKDDPREIDCIIAWAAQHHTGLLREVRHAG